MKKIKVGIIGGAGYTGGELIRLLVNHSLTDLIFVHSKSNAGRPLHTVHQDLVNETEMQFSAFANNDVDILFLCTGHGDSKKYLEENDVPGHVKIISLSQDFRLKANARIKNKNFIYGLPEINRE